VEQFVGQAADPGIPAVSPECSTWNILRSPDLPDRNLGDRDPLKLTASTVGKLFHVEHSDAHSEPMSYWEDLVDGGSGQGSLLSPWNNSAEFPSSIEGVSSARAPCPPPWRDARLFPVEHFSGASGSSRPESRGGPRGRSVGDTPMGNCSTWNNLLSLRLLDFGSLRTFVWPAKGPLRRPPR
jgi:hypothetical protein